MSDVQINDRNLRQLLKAFKKIPVARVGILGTKGARKDATASNATIGAAHEFGTEHLPQRSFLRVPLSDHLGEYLGRAGAFDKNTLDRVVKEGSIREWVGKMAIVAEQIVAEAFATEGFGKWVPWKRKGYANNANMILDDTGQLKRSITSEVK